MDSCNKCPSPRGPIEDAVIEKIKCEIKSDEELTKIKSLCIQASNRSKECMESKRSIDSKISDLECLIKKLQDELNELACASKSAQSCSQSCEPEYDPCDPCKPAPRPCSNEPSLCFEEQIGCGQNHIEKEEDNCSSKKSNPCDRVDEKKNTETVTKSPSNRFPIILRDIGHISKSEDMSTNKAPIKQSTENVTNTKNDSCDWKYCKKDTREEENPIVDSESITVMIAELRAEINDTIHTLNKDSNCKSK